MSIEKEGSLQSGGKSGRLRGGGRCALRLTKRRGQGIIKSGTYLIWRGRSGLKTTRALAWLLAGLMLWPLLARGEEKRVTMTFLGDCAIGGEDRLREKEESFDGYLRRYGMGYFFEKVQPILAADDWTVANLEGVFSDIESGKMENKTYCFRGPSAYTEVLKGSGVECVNVANNHSLDYRDIGMRRTVKALEEAGIAWFGCNMVVKQVYTYEQDGIRIGFLGVDANYMHQDRPAVTRQLNALKKQGCQLIVASLHGGREYFEKRDRGQETKARWLIDNGCGLVICHHPHVLQGIDLYKGATICYSLGNFVFGGNTAIKRARARYSAMFQFTFSFDEENRYLGQQLNLIPVFVSADAEINTYQPYPVGGSDAQAVLRCIQVDTAFPLNPYVENVGAVQDFVPANHEK